MMIKLLNLVSNSFHHFKKTDEMDAVRNVERICYDGFRNGSYNILMAIIAIPLSIIWGLLDAFWQFIIVWVVTPQLNLMKIIFSPIFALPGLILRPFKNLLFRISKMICVCFRNVKKKLSVAVTSVDDNKNDDELMKTNIAIINNDNNKEMIELAITPDMNEVGADNVEI